MAFKKIYAGIFQPVAGKRAEPDFSKPLHDQPDVITIDRISDRSFSMNNQRIVIKMKEPAPTGYIFCLYTRDGENLYGEYRDAPRLIKGSHFIANFTSGLFTKSFERS